VLKERRFLSRRFSIDPAVEQAIGMEPVTGFELGPADKKSNYDLCPCQNGRQTIITNASSVNQFPIGVATRMEKSYAFYSIQAGRGLPLSNNFL